MKKNIWSQALIPALIIGVSLSSTAQAGSSKYSYIKTALPAQQKEVFTHMNAEQQNKIKAVVDQHATQSQTPPPAVVMVKINEDEIPQMAITELRSTTLTNTTTGFSQDATLKLEDGVVVAVMDKDGWEVAHAAGQNKITSGETGATYHYTRGKLRSRTKSKRKFKRISFKKCMKKRACRKSFHRISSKLKKSRYIPTRLRAKRCMQNKTCRRNVKRIIRRYSTKHCYIPTKGRKVCKVKAIK